MKFPRTVYKVCWVVGPNERPVLSKAEIIGKKGSWIELRVDAGTWKENGIGDWRETKLEAVKHRIVSNVESIAFWSRVSNQEQFIARLQAEIPHLVELAYKLGSHI